MIIEGFDVHKAFGRNQALNGLNFQVREGSAYAILGSNGAGKSTAIKLMMNIIAPSRGRISILGTDAQGLTPATLTQIGYVAEAQVLPQHLTVDEYLSYLRPFYPHWDIALETQLLKKFGLPTDSKVRQLSHGMRMKTALVAALSFHPKLLVLDEPFSGLDPLVRDELLEGLLDRAGDTTIFISSHELHEIEGLVTDVGYLQDGLMVFEEDIDTLKDRVREVRVTLDVASVPSNYPLNWLNPSVSGNVLTFVDNTYSDDRLAREIAEHIGAVKHVDVQMLPLRAVFTAYARAAQNRGN